MKNKKTRKIIHTMTVLLATVVFVFSLTSAAHASVLFEDNFDSSPDWQSQQGVNSDNHVWPTTWAVEDGGACTTYCPPKNWTTYRGVASAWDPRRNDTYAVNSIGARGGNGKGFVYWHEAMGSWADGAGLEKFLSYDGYPELYMRYYERWDPAFEWSHADQHKQADLFSNQLPLSTSNNFDSRGSLYWGAPEMIIGWYYNTTYTYINESLRMAPHYDATSTSQCNKTHSDVPLPVDGEWHAYEYRAKLNSAPGVPDGILDVWIDGVKQTSASCADVEYVNSIPWVAHAHYSNMLTGAITPTNQMKGYRVIDISGTGTFHITTGVNDVIRVKYDTGDYINITLAPGDYTGDALASVMAAAFSDTFAASFTGTWNSSSRHFVITAPANHILAIYPTGTINMTLGFSVTSTINSQANVLTSIYEAGGQTGSVEPNWLVDCPNKGDTCTDGEITWENYSNFSFTQFTLHDNFYTATDFDSEHWIYDDDVVVSTSYVGPDYVIGGGTADTTAPNSPQGLSVW